MKQSILHLHLLLVLGLAGAAVSWGCPSDDDDTSGDDDSEDDDSGDDDSGDDDTYDCYANPLETGRAADGSGLVRGTIDGTDYWFVIDTAAQVIFADLEVSGDFTGYFNADVEIGWFAHPKWSLKGRDLAPNEAFVGQDIGALLGQDIFMQSYTFFDPAAVQAYVCPAVPVGDPPGLSGPPQTHSYVLENQFAVTEVDLGAPDPTALMLDTGLPVTYLTEDVFAAVDTGAPRLHGWVFRTNYGEDPAYVTRVPQFGFGGDLIIDQEVVVIPTEHHLANILAASGVFVSGFLGNSVMDRYAYGIDGLGSNLELWPVTSPWLAPDRWVRVGVEVTWRDGQYLLEFVFHGTDAEAQGLVAGDVLTSIDGTDTTTMTLWELHQALRGSDGEVRALELEGGGGPYAADVQVEELLP